ncbi:MAG: hypothetical protein K2N06_12610 [Oscillospiraceae bacterium]|nr:hypothetical protein [Oscillospiraceae bacterium]
MNWEPLSSELVSAISTEIRYHHELKEKTGMLYQQIAEFPCDIESKVKFLLWHWGWDGIRREGAIYIISAINDSGFTIPDNVKMFYEQLYGLTLPMKKKKIPADEYGGILRFRFSEKGDVQLKDWLIGAECLSAKFDDDILPIGYRMNYNGFSSSGQQINGWEDPYYRPCGAWGYELYLGSSSRIYVWDTEVSDYIGIEAENVISFFASAFGLIPDTERYYGCTSDADFARIEKIEKLWNQGQYKQNCLRGNT